jgi:hypothetical protein
MMTRSVIRARRGGPPRVVSAPETRIDHGWRGFHGSHSHPSHGRLRGCSGLGCRMLGYNTGPESGNAKCPEVGPNSPQPEHLTALASCGTPVGRVPYAGGHARSRGPSGAARRPLPSLPLPRALLAPAPGAAAVTYGCRSPEAGAGFLEPSRAGDLCDVRNLRRPAVDWPECGALGVAPLRTNPGLRQTPDDRPHRL